MLEINGCQDFYNKQKQVNFLSSISSEIRYGNSKNAKSQKGNKKKIVKLLNRKEQIREEKEYERDRQ